MGIHHQNALGSVLQDRRVERPGRFQLTGQALQHAPIALLVEQGLDLGLENLRVERFEHVVHGATGVTLEHGRFGLFIGGEENDRGQPGALAAAHQSGDFEAVHLRHLYIQQHQVDIVFKQSTQGFHPRVCRQHLPILTGQQCPHADEVFGVIVYHQKNRVAIQWLRVRLSAIHAASLLCDRLQDTVGSTSTLDLSG